MKKLKPIKWRSLRNSLKAISIALTVGCLNLASQVSAQRTMTLKLDSATLSDSMINAVSTINLFGQLINGSLKNGDCLVLTKAQPYVLSKQLYEQSSGLNDFYVPFPRALQYSVGDSAQASASLQRTDDYSLQIKVTSDFPGEDFAFTLNSIKNPFSQVQNTEISVKHFPSCGQRETPCFDNKSCSKPLITLYSIPETAKLAQPTSSIRPAEGLATNTVATTNGTFTIKFKPGPEFPRYGGTITILLPDWFSGSDRQTGVFSLSPKTICSAPTSVFTVETQQTASLAHTLLYSKYTVGSEIELTCTNYRNPLKAGIISGFRISVSDRETPSNLVAIYPQWSFTVSELAPLELPLPLKFELFSLNSDVPTQTSLPIQTDIGLSIEFNMGVIPVDDRGCFVKYTFPFDMPLPESALSGGYLSSRDSGEQMMLSSANGINLQPNIEYFIRNQAYAKGNYIILKGCTFERAVGLNSKAKVRFTGVKTPVAVKGTSTFTVEVFKTFDPLSYKLSDLVVKTSGSIPAERFHGGKITNGVFTGLIRNIQQTSATHRIEFTLQSSLPAKDARFETRIVIKMPEKLSISPGVVVIPFVKNLDGHLLDPQIKIETDFTGCATPAVCYSITTKNLIRVPAGTQIGLSITGTTNQESEQPAGKWAVWTQLKDINTGVYFSIDEGNFTSDWTAVAGNIVVAGRATTASSYMNYKENVKYTIYAQMQNYVPDGGIVEVFLPPQIKLISSPFSAFESSSLNLKPTTEFTEKSFKLKAVGNVKAGAVTIIFGGVRNPVSFLPTDVFNMTAKDSQGFAVGGGSLDNIVMTLPAIFSDMNVTAANRTNGAVTDYFFSFRALLPLFNGDRFNIIFPTEIKTPRFPICQAQSCLEEIVCTGESGRIGIHFIKLKPDCGLPNSTVGFRIEGIGNPSSMVKSGSLQAYWTSEDYRLVANYSSTLGLHIQNDQMAQLDAGKVSLHQVKLDFEIETLYTLTFKPTNPIPRSGWIKVTYPSTVQIKDPELFVQNCQIITSLSFRGPDHCSLIASKRQIWIYDVFADSKTYASTIQMEFLLTNPSTNFFGSTPDSELAFHITTYAFDPSLLFEMERDYYSAVTVRNFIRKVLPEPESLGKGIDTLVGDSVRPELKCREPCYNCIDNDPDYCTACWGPGSNDNKLVFLQRSNGKSTCKTQCDVKSTVNGQAVKTKNQAGQEIESKTYFVCTDCDVTCNTCLGQNATGNEGDAGKCLTCDPAFKYFMPKLQTCAPQCPGGYYKQVDIPWGPSIEDRSSCGECKAPCTSCRACNPLQDKNCDPNDPESGAKFCTACDQSKFFPVHVDDLDTPEQYFSQEISMALAVGTALSPIQLDYIHTHFNRSNINIEQFLNKKVFALPDGSRISKPLTETGVQIPQQGQCLAFCPDGFASVNGLCRQCEGACATCRSDTTRCLSCKQDGNLEFLFGRVCLEYCPDGTVADEKQRKCIGCISGCDRCRLEDTNACLKCKFPLLLLNETCYGQCPDGYRANFWNTRCVLDEQLKLIYFPQILMLILALVICIAGKYSSKNVFGQHRIFLSFYSIAGVVDVLTMWTQLIFTLIYGEPWQLFVPVIALIINYYLNYCYIKLWNTLDPPKPNDDDDLSVKEVLRIRECDMHFDLWNTKYFKVAKYIKRLVALLSHKVFHLPYTHFYGYLHLTVRIQDNLQAWEWDIAHWAKWRTGALPNETLESGVALFHGRLVDRRQGRDARSKSEILGDDDDFEGGRTDRPLINAGREFNPFDFVQSPLATGDPIPDLRVLNLFKKQVKLDFLFIRSVMVGGNIFLLAFSFAHTELNQLEMCSIESLIMGVLMMAMQWQVLRSWDDLKLPFKMKDTKSNYLFKQIRYPQELRRLEQYLSGEEPVNEEWKKLLTLYKLPQIYLDNKLEELLNIFGRRQCKSCIEFPTGTELEADPRRHRSFPLSPRGEELYRGMEAEFNMVDFQLHYHDINESDVPTAMFSSVARDLSEYGIRGLDSKVLKAINRKGGNLGTPGNDSNKKRNGSKKRRGRKNKYYRQIDHEDGQEANHISENSDEDHLDHIREEDDDDEEAIAKAKQQHLEARLRAREEETLQAEILRKQKAEEDLRLELAKQKEIKTQAEKEEQARIMREKQEQLRREQEQRMERLVAAKKRQQQEEARKKQAIADLEHKRQAEERERKSQNEKRRRAMSKLSNNSKVSNNGKKSAERDERAGSTLSILVQEDALKNFGRPKNVIEVPPNPNTRRFNECQILGDLDHNRNGRIVVGPIEPVSGCYFDKQGRKTNQRGYLLDSAGNVINYVNGQIMFRKEELDEREEIPQPFLLESHGFNPHAIRGNFDINPQKKWIINQDPHNPGRYVDKKGALVTVRGYRIDSSGNLIDNNGVMVLHKSQLTQNGEIPKLLTYTGRRFDVLDCIGVFEKDANGQILIPRNAQTGGLCDLMGRRVNSNGYLVDKHENVIDSDGKVLFLNRHLVAEEIPKIFAFSKFNISSILGNFDMDPLGVPVLTRTASGGFMDQNGMIVTSKGYLIDKDGNIINKRGQLVFRRSILTEDGDIPKVFRAGLIKTNSESSLSRIMSELNSHPVDDDQLGKQSQNQDLNEQRCSEIDLDDDESDDEEGLAAFKSGAGLSKQRGKKKKKRQEFEGPSLREHLLAGAYGGVAQPKPKRAGMKYTTDIDAGLRDIVNPQMLRDASMPSQIGRKLVLNVTGNGSISGLGSDHQNSGRGQAQTQLKRMGTAGQPFGNLGESESGSISAAILPASVLVDRRETDLEQTGAQTTLKTKFPDSRLKRQPGHFSKLSKYRAEPDFGQMLTRDVDKFLQDSHWEAASVGAKLSRQSRGQSARSGSNVERIKGLEKTYLPKAGDQGRGGMSALQATGNTVAGTFSKSRAAGLKGQLATSTGVLPKLRNIAIRRNSSNKNESEENSTYQLQLKNQRGASMQNIRASRGADGAASKLSSKQQFHQSSMASLHQKSSSVTRSFQHAK